MDKKLGLTKEFFETEYINNGKTLKQISKEIGCHWKTLLKTMNKVGIKTRRKSAIGRYIDKNGYVRIKNTNHPKSHNGYVYEHIIVLENKIGRMLLPNEECHHINEVKNDNRPENLQVKTKVEHMILHHSGIRNNRCKINVGTAKKIKNDLNNNIPIIDICNKYKVTKNIIYSISKGLTWKSA